MPFRGVIHTPIFVFSKAKQMMFLVNRKCSVIFVFSKAEQVMFFVNREMFSEFRIQ